MFSKWKLISLLTFLVKGNWAAVVALVLFAAATSFCVLTDACTLSESGVQVDGDGRLLIDLFLDQLSQP